MRYLNDTRLPLGVKYLLIISIIIHILQYMPVIGPFLMEWGALVPKSAFQSGHIWRFWTYMFLHGNPWHLAFNLLALWMFGVDIEHKWGTRRFVYFYFIGGVGSGLLSFIMWNSQIVGASGALLALLTVFAYYYPNRQILMFFIFPVPSRIAVIIIGVISILMARSGDNIAHLTHLGGIIIALIYLRYYDHVVRWNIHRRAVKAEKTMRSNAEKKIHKDRYFEEVIDPILKKIKEQGMDSLTREERKKLKEASKKKE